MHKDGRSPRKIKAQVRFLNIHLKLLFLQFPACKAERTIRQGSEKNHGKFGKLKVILYGYNGRNVDKTCRAQIMQRHWNSFLVRDKKLLKEFLKRNDMIRFAFC